MDSDEENVNPHDENNTAQTGASFGPSFPTMTKSSPLALRHNLLPTGEFTQLSLSTIRI
jgi:hypothetical protein